MVFPLVFSVPYSFETGSLTESGESVWRPARPSVILSVPATHEVTGVHGFYAWPFLALYVGSRL